MYTRNGLDKLQSIPVTEVYKNFLYLIFWVVVLCSMDTKVLEDCAASNFRVEIVSNHHTTWHKNIENLKSCKTHFLSNELQ